ncbi:MAG: UPF0182 family protein [Clostridia bacterium]|nr:UPF0182 family protein [Clostridia bacterium]
MNNKATQKFQHKALLIVAIVVVVGALFLSLVNFIGDFLWFKEMGYLGVFFKQLVTQLKVGIPTFVVISILLYMYLTFLRKGYFKKIASTENTNMKRLKTITVVLALLFGAAVTFVTVSRLWFEILKFANASSFDIADPLFHIDISFYIFKLDFLTQLNEILIGVIVGFVILTVVYYIVLMTMHTPDLFEEQPQPEQTSQESQGEARYSGSSNPFGENSPFGQASEIFEKMGFKRPEPKPRKQLDDNNFRQLMSIASGKLTGLGCIFFLMLALDFFLKQFDLLHVHTGVVYGAGFTDVTVTLWKFRILCILSLAAAVMFVIFMAKKNYKKLLTIPVLMIIVGLLGTGLSALVQNFIVSPDELEKETPYLLNNIEYTQYAYGLDDVAIKSFAADNTLTAQSIADNMDTITNIRINDFEPAEQFYNQTQSIRQYYTFNDVDNDRYMVNGEYTQTFLSAREIDENKISDTWLNMHLKYTHGYGVSMSRVDKVTSSGQPDIIVGNIPPESAVDEIAITRPEIYFGELSNEYVVVGTDEQEFDYPNGNTNSYNMYEGTAGIKMNLFNRLVFSIREGSIQLLVSSNINGDSRIIINRNVVQRVRKIMPYLSYEDDPYMVTVDGRLFWIIDAYTVSNLYPYSEPYTDQTNVNYIRNSVKVVVDAYNGNTDYYVIDEQDPIAMTYQKIYPTLFKSIDQLPDGLQEHLRYPNALFQVQAQVYAKYHMEDVNVFYQSEDLWDIANEIYGMEKQQIIPNYYIAKLPGESKAEFFNSVPFTPRSKQNMTALMIARNDGENYGQLVLYQFPKSKTVYGTEQIEAQIDQNTEISKDFTLWASNGTTYRRGNLFVIPINTSILYVEPVYLEAQNSSIPEVKRIIVVYKDQIAYGETLAECIQELFRYDIDKDKNDASIIDDGSDEPDDQGGNTEPGTYTQDELIAKAQESFDKAQEALRNGDWAAYGQYMDELSEYLGQLSGGGNASNFTVIPDSEGTDSGETDTEDTGN